MLEEGFEEGFEDGFDECVEDWGNGTLGRACVLSHELSSLSKCRVAASRSLRSSSANSRLAQFAPLIISRVDSALRSISHCCLIFVASILDDISTC
jgi:hypothetical protein